MGFFQRDSTASVWLSFSNPVMWTLIALVVSGIGLYVELR